MSLLEVKNLSVEFRTERGVVRAIEDVNFHVNTGETVGIVGESGCGKSVTALAVLGLIPSPPGKIVSGYIKYNNKDLGKLRAKEYRRLRGKEISMIFQEPMTALNPVLRIETQLCDVIKLHNPGISHKEAKKRAIECLARVRVPEKRIGSYPHQLSGGMRQRVMIAMALSCGAKVLLADEPTTALDVTTQAQVLEEINRLKEELGMGVVMITHDMGVIAETCERVLVMYCGKVVESASVGELFAAPRHPYTKALLESIPKLTKTKLKKLPTIEGVVPDLFDLPTGCRFQDRCPKVSEMCRKDSPGLVGESHKVSCFHPET